MVAMHDYDYLHLEKSRNSITHLWKRYDAKIINENFNAREKSNGIVQNNKITFKLGIWCVFDADVRIAYKGTE